MRIIFGLLKQIILWPLIVKHEIFIKYFTTVKKVYQLVFFNGYSTRNPYVLSVPKHITCKFEQSPMNQFIELVLYLRISLNISRFRKALKTLLVQKCSYNVGENLNDFFKVKLTLTRLFHSKIYSRMNKLLYSELLYFFIFYYLFFPPHKYSDEHGAIDVYNFI